MRAASKTTLLVQAKGHHYSLQELLAGDAEAVETYRGGSFACIYLAPYNYHRIHMPYAGSCARRSTCRASLFSVNAATARAVPRVFARNERLICDFETPLGRMAVILVGALVRRQHRDGHCGEVNPPPRRQAPVRMRAGVTAELGTGEETGSLQHGIDCRAAVRAQSHRAGIESLRAGSTVQLGERIGAAAVIAMSWRRDLGHRDARSRGRRMLRATREYFAATRVLEVETPALSAAAVTDVHLASVDAIAAAVAIIPAHLARVRDEAPARRRLRRHLADRARCIATARAAAGTTPSSR